MLMRLEAVGAFPKQLNRLRTTTLPITTMSVKNQETRYRAECSDCGWHFEHEHRPWVESSAENHEELYRKIEGHETSIDEVLA